MIAAARELGIRSPVAAWRAASNFVRTVWDPTRSDIQHGINSFVYRGLAEAPPEQIRKLEAAQPELADLYRSGYDPALDPARFEHLPEGTLGREWARFIRENQIRPLETLLALGEPKSLLEYLFRRAYKLHDLMHVVLGADASVLGEVRIVSYTLGQSQNDSPRAAAMALAVLFMNIGLRRPHEVHEAIRLAHEYWQLGARSPWHVTTRIEDWLERPVTELRARMLIDAPPAEAPAARQVA
jgi:ubiquinone biosynthesis protein Coq4